MERPILQIKCHSSKEQFDHWQGRGVGDGAGVRQFQGQVGVAVAGVMEGFFLNAASVLVMTITNMIPIVTP